MAQQAITYGTVPNDRTGMTLREATKRAHENFTDLYTQFGGLAGSAAATAAGEAARRRLGDEEGALALFTGQSAAALDYATTKSYLGRPSGLVPITRASNASFRGRDGVFRTALSNEGRYSYDRVTRRPKGLRIERAATNLFVQSKNIGTTGWTVGRATVNDAAAADIFGGITATELIEDTTALLSHYVAQSLTPAASTEYTMSFVAQANTRTEFGVIISSGFNGVSQTAHFDTVTGVASTIAGTVVVGMEDLGGGFWLCRATATSGMAPSLSTFYITLASGGTIYYSGDGVSSGYVSDAQLETGPVATSRIATTTTSATRAADAVSALLSTIPFSSGGFTGVVDFEVATVAVGGQRAVNVSDGGSPNLVEVTSLSGTPTSLSLLVSSGGVSQTNISLTTSLAVGTRYRVAFSVSTNDVRVAMNGALIGTDTSVVLPVGLTKLTVGNNGGGSGGLNGSVREAAVVTRVYDNTDLIALSVIPA